MDDDYFYTLVTSRTKKKNRPCLKCRIPFESHSNGNRICGQCNLHNKNSSVNSTYQIWESKKIKA